jgi:hypothetical protein
MMSLEKTRSTSLLHAGCGRLEAEVYRLRDLAERAADMLTAYGELIRRDGASHVEEHHYLPEVEHTARELRRCALGPNVEVQRSAAGRSAATQG